MIGKRAVTVLLAVALFFCFLNEAHAVPAAPGVKTLRQPDGTVLRVRQWGDERSHGIETEEGYALVFDEGLKRWTYAEHGPDGTLASSKLIAGKDTPPRSARGLRPRKAGAEKKTTKETLREQARGASPAPASGSNSLPQPVAPATGNGNIPVLLIKYADTAAPTTTAQQFEDLFFKDGSAGVRDYYRQVSYNAFTVSSGPGGVRGWSAAAQGHDYYGANDANGDDMYPATLVGEAVQAADATFDFAPYDQDGDCYVDVVSIIYQGTAESDGGPTTDIWPHRWNLASARQYRYSVSGVYDGPGTYTTNDTCAADPSVMVKVNDYTAQSETQDGNITTVGTFTHEYGHALGLPDLYDTDGSSEGAGRWSLMASGSWNSVTRAGDSPAHLDPWSKSKLGWVTPAVVSGTLAAETVTQATTAADVYQLLDGTPSAGEYFLVENRQKAGFDAGLPGAGLLIWHIDAGVSTNRNECYPGGPSCSSQHYKVALVQADDLFDLEKGTDRGDAGDPYPGTTDNRTFSAASAPSSDLYSGGLSNASVTAISDAGAAMTATLTAIFVPPPPLAEALDQPDWTFTTTGDANWTGQTFVTHDGVDAAQANGIGDNQSMRLETTRTFAAAGSASFWWKVSSESDYDYLRFFIDGVEMNAISGEVGWTQQSWPVGAGDHTLAWEYAKDINTASGSDKGWVDEVAIGPPLCTLTVASTNPASGASVQVSPADANGRGNGKTQLQRIYACDTPVTLTAPAAAGGQVFQSWSGCDGGSGVTCTLTVGADRTATANFLGQAVCSSARAIAAGESHSYRNDGAGSTSMVDSYACISAWDESGPEYTYTFTAPQAGAFTATLSGMGVDLDVFVLDKDGGCVGGSCLAYGNNQAQWTAAAGHEYYIVVDGYLGAAGDYTLRVASANAAPTEIALSGNSVAENLDPGTTVGTLSGTDPNAGDTLTYSLASGAGGADNASFTILDQALLTTASFDYETKSSCGIRVRATDQGGLFYEKTFTILVTDVNEAPTDIALSPGSVAEKRPAGTAVGTFETTDPDAGNTFTYTLVAGSGSADNDSFSIAGDSLQTAAVFSLPVKSSYAIRVRATDQGGLWTEKPFVVTVVPGRHARNDFDGDGRSDIGCYFPDGGNWYGFNSTDGFWQTQFGYAGTVPVTGDFDGDGRSDFGCYDAGGGNWYLMRSTEGFWQTTFGYEGTIPIVGDFDGDGRDDFGCYYAPGGNWYLYRSTEGFWQTTFGYEGTIPIVGDFDGDGRDDIGCYYPAGGNWYLFKSTEEFRQTQFGYAATEPVIGDFDGDGRDDFGCYYPGGGNWYLFKSTEGFWQAQFGYSGTIPLGSTLR